MVLREHSEDKQTIENDNYASNVLSLNQDLPLHETYPFARAAQKVATALEPQMLKETAFSDCSNLLNGGAPNQARSGGAGDAITITNSLEGTTTIQNLRDKLRNENVLTSSGQLTQEPSITDNRAAAFSNPTIDIQQLPAEP